MDYKEIKRRERRTNKTMHKKNVILLFVLTTLFAAVSASASHYLINKSHNQTSNSTQNEIVYTDNTGNIEATETTPTPEPTPTEATEQVSTATPTPPPTPTPNVRRGTAQPIPDDIRTYMTGRSYKQNSNISLDDLSYLTIPHYDFNNNIQEGHMVVNSSLAEDVLDIFAELYDIKYPIERMELVDNYNASDYESIEDNNTSAFNYRESTSGSGKLSMHALGRAIDINPQINPYVRADGTGKHQNAAEYWSRNKSKWTSDIAKDAYIGTDSEIYNIFIKHGWKWGGNWTSYRDYQHFEK